jgi:uncharacterized membrane protein YeiB
MNETISDSESGVELSLVDSPAIAPIKASERLDVMDILRGVALVGILLMNIEWFNRSFDGLGEFDKALTGFDHATGWLVRCFVEGKFYKIFSLLFGMGFAVMLVRAQEAGRPFVAWFTRRMVVLYLIGLLHFIFLFPGDILHDYALGGMLLLGWILLFRTRRLSRFNNPATFLRIALVALMVPFILAAAMGIFFGLANDWSELEQRWTDEQQITETVDERVAEAAKAPPADESGDEEAATGDESTAGDDAEPDAAEDTGEEPDDDADKMEKTITERVEQRLEREKYKLEEIAAFSRGSYREATLYRARTTTRMLQFSPVFGITVLLPVFLIGYWFVVSGTLRHHRERQQLFKWMAIIGTTFGLAFTVGGLTILQHPASHIARSIGFTGGALFFFSQYLLSAGYVGLIVLAADTVRGRRWLQPLSPLGRMALTNYIMHSLILVLIFHAYGAGGFGRISRAPQMLIVVAIMAFQVLFSAWWLKRYRFGPLEWVWRSLTYKSWQPMRITA